MARELKTVLQSMREYYQHITVCDRRHALKEVFQELILCGLAQAGFFEKAAFYGGAALRIFYGLNRFSENLDFSLVSPDPDFSLDLYVEMLQEFLDCFGVECEISGKMKSRQSAVQPAFQKTNTKEQILTLFQRNLSGSVNPDEKVRIRIEVDLDSPARAKYESKIRMLPYPYRVRLYEPSSLFAGNIHAILCRSLENRVKGSDLYDYVFCLSSSIPLNLDSLNEKLIRSGLISCPVDQKELVALLEEKFDTIDYAEAVKDVLPYIPASAKAALDLWSAEFFKEITASLKVSEEPA